MYMVFAPRFEIVEEALEDGCFLTAGVGPGDTTWSVDSGAGLTGGRYFIGDAANEERVLLVAGGATSIQVQRGYESSTPGSWPAGTRMKKLPPISGFQSDVEWGATISNIAVTGDASLKVGGDSERIEESDSAVPVHRLLGGLQVRRGRLALAVVEQGAREAHRPERYRGRARGHDPVLCHGGARPLPRHVPVHGLRQGRSHGGRRGARRIAHRSVPQRVRRHHGEREDRVGGSGRKPHRRPHRSVRKNAASTGYYFYFDYLWPLVPQDVPDPQKEYPDVSLAIDFDTDHGYKKPPAWHLWHLQKLGFNGHADVYMGVFWNNKRRRVGATYPYATIEYASRTAWPRRGAATL